MNMWNRAIALGMTLGMLISSIPLFAYADEMIGEGDTYIVAEDETEVVMAPEIDEVDEDIFDDDLFADVDESEIEDELVLGIAAKDTAEELQTAESDIVESGTCGENLTWTLDSEGTLIISGVGSMSGSAQHSWEGGFIDSPFKRRADIKSVIIMEGVTSVGYEAFYYCSSLESVSIPNTVTFIGGFAFDGCKITSISIPNSVTEIESYAFMNSRITNITIPNSVEIIGDYLFAGCSKLENIYVSEGNTHYVDLDGVLYDFSLTKLKCCPARKDRISIPNSVTTICKGAFEGCSEIYQVSLPTGLNTIERMAFGSCGLKDITIPEGVTSIPDNAFSQSRLETISIPSSVIRIEDNAFALCDLLEVFFTGTEEQWSSIEFGEDVLNELDGVTIHFNGSGGGQGSGGSNDPVTGRGNELVFSTDVWGFDNYSHSTCKIDNIYINSLINNLDPVSRATVQENAAKGAGGHCFGMSTTVILNKLGIEDMTRWDYVDCLRKVNENGTSSYVRCYYHAMQYLSDFSREVYSFSRYSRTEQLKILAERADKVKDGGNPVLLCFRKDGWGAHAVVAYALESGIFISPATGKEFDRRILLYDCNAVDWSEYTCLLFRYGTGEWEIPYYASKDVASFYGAELMCATNNTAVFDSRVNNNLSESGNTSVLHIDSNTSVILKKKGTNEQWVINKNSGTVTGSSQLLSYFDIDGEADENTGFQIILPGLESAYTIEPISDDPEPLEVGIQSSNQYVSVQCGAVKEVEFNLGEAVSIIDNVGEYCVILADNNMQQEGQYDTFSFSGNNSGNLTLSLDNNGIAIKGDDIEGMVVDASDGTEHTSVVVSDSQTFLISNQKPISEHTHTWDSGKVTKAATTTAVGIKTFTCSVCGKTRTEEIAMLAAAPVSAAPAEQITIPKKPSIKKPSSAKGKITVNWKHFKQTKKTKPIWKKIKKVQIQCAADKGFTNIVKTTMVGKGKTKEVIKGLQKNTTYFVRVRYFDGTGYSKWSGVKKIKTKK